MGALQKLEMELGAEDDAWRLPPSHHDTGHVRPP